MWLTSICWTVRSRKVFSLRTLMRLLGPLQPMLVPRPPFSFTTTSLFRLSAMLSGIPFTLILSYGWIWDKDKKEKQLSVRAYFHFFSIWRIILYGLELHPMTTLKLLNFTQMLLLLVCVYLPQWFFYKKYWWVRGQMLRLVSCYDHACGQSSRITRINLQAHQTTTTHIVQAQHFS